MFKLTRPLVFLDLEATGLDRENDRIIQICLTKISPRKDKSEYRKTILSIYINPMIDIPESSTKIHGITNEDAKRWKPFDFYAERIFEFISDCDLAGYNSNWFDIPLLANELARCGITLDPSKFHMIDVGNLFKIKEPRNLENAVRFYCKKELKNAHDACADVEATIDVFEIQLNYYNDLPQTVEEMALYTNYNCKVADLSGKFVYNTDGDLLLNFGKYKGEKALEHRDFIDWMIYKGTFAPDTLAICRKVLLTPPNDPDMPW